MEEAIIHYTNQQSKEQRDKLIEYFKYWNSADIEEFIIRRKKLGGKKFLDQRLSFGSFLMTLLPMKDLLDKLEVDSQSHST
uniref:Uncharacterized protein n=1 Tax=viral metagenome TaxID=1070528 RepID=A0A6C0ER32_9ZZZZ